MRRNLLCKTLQNNFVMCYNKTMVEVLAPVGSIQALKAAIYSGADAVYLGLDLFNARIKADNFNKENIKEWTDYCHLFGVKVYVTFNTSIKQGEKQKFEQYVDIAAKARVDAFIVTDLGCLDILKKYNVPLHGSTQIGVHNLAGAKVLEELGFTRVVLARETLFDDIMKIRQNTSLEIEYFVHGALCVSFSGACLMSSMMSGDSGNRGRCNQPCRLKYSSSFSRKEKYLLSPKDQCFIADLAKLLSVGVDSLKIEGRLKQPHYVGEVVGQYRQAVDAFYADKTFKADKSALKRAYNRGNFTRGYNFDTTNGIMYDKVNGTIGESVGKIISARKGEITVKLNGRINRGDGVKVIYDGEEIGGFSINNINIKGDTANLAVTNQYPIGSEICVTSDKTQIDKFADIRPKITIDISLTAKLGERLKLTAYCGEVVTRVEGDIVESSQKYAATEDGVKKQLLRFGESNFEIKNCSIDIDDSNDIFIPSSTLNSLRRELVEKLESDMLLQYEKRMQRVEYKSSKECFYAHDTLKSKSRIWCEIDSESQNFDCLDKLGNKINLVINYSSKIGQFIEIILKNDLIQNKTEDIYLKLPRVARGKDYDDIDDYLSKSSKKYKGIVADNLYGVYLARKYGLKLVGGIGLNIYNDNIQNVLGLDEQIMSVELNSKELLKGGIIYAYGLLPVMTLLHCPVQVNTGCSCADCRYDGDFYYYDRRGKYLIKRLKLNYCQFSLYNQQKLDIIGKTSGWDYQVYLNLADCDKDKVSEVVAKYSNKTGSSEENSTYGHLFRGVK